MPSLQRYIVAAMIVAAMVGLSAGTYAATDPGDLVDLCGDLYGAVFGAPNGEPLGACQWDMSLIHASENGSYPVATGKGVTVGVIDSGVNLIHPDIAPNLDVDRSCSFVFDDTPAADPREVANGDCSNKSAVQDLDSHGTHVASTIAAPINGIGIAGVAPEATIVGLKACTIAGYCFADSVAAALRYAYLNRTSMSSPHVAGVAALIKQLHPKWNPGAVKAHLQNSAQHLYCPPNWEPLGESDECARCYGNGGRTSFFGHGLVDASAAAQESTNGVQAAAVDVAEETADSDVVAANAKLLAAGNTLYLPIAIGVDSN